MPGGRFLLALMLTIGAGIALAVPAPPASAAETFPYGTDGAVICQLSVAGTLPADDDLDHTDGLPAKSFVRWAPDMGVSVSFACVGQEDSSVVVHPITGFAVSLSDGKLVRIATSTAHDAVSVSMGCEFDEAEGISSNCYGHAPPESMVLHSFARDGRAFRFAGRLDLEPWSDICNPGDDGAGAYWPYNQSPCTAGVITDPYANLIRRTAVCITPLYSPEPVFSGLNSCATLSDGHGSNTITETGAAVAVDFPDFNPTNGDPDAGSESDGCTGLGWLLTDLDTGKKWARSIGVATIRFESEHEYTLRANWKGTIPSLRLQIKDGTVVGYTRTHYKPTSPHTFTDITGIDGEVQVSLTGFATNGDINPKCQAVVTDQTDKPQGDRLETCFLATPDIEWNAPSTWVPGIVGAGVCVLEWAFVPEKSFSERANEVRESSDAAGAVVEGVGSVRAVVDELGSPAAVSCAGPEVPVPPAPPQHPMSVCDGTSLHDGAYWARRTTELGVLIGSGFVIWQMLASTLWGATVVYHRGDDIEGVKARNMGNWE